MSKISNEENDKFLKAEIEEIKFQKWLASEKAGYDLGNNFCLEWIKEHGREFREKYFNSKEKK